MRSRIAVTLWVFIASIARPCAAQDANPDQVARSIYQRLAEAVESEGGHSVTRGGGTAGEYFRSLDAGQLRALFRFCDPLEPDSWSPKGRESLRPGIVERLGELEGQTLVESFVDPQNPEDFHWWDEAVAGWTKADPNAAFAWALASSDARHLPAVLRTVVAVHRDKIGDYLEHPQLSGKPAAREALANLGRAIIVSDGNEGWEWIQGLPADDRRAVAPQLIGQLSLVLPENAAELAIESDAEEGLTLAIGNWALSDPGGVCRWLLAKLPEDEKRDLLHRMTIAIWTELDAAAAWEHLSGLPEPRQLALLERSIYWHRTFLDPPGKPRLSLQASLHHYAMLGDPAPKGDRLADQVDQHFHMMARSVHGETLLVLMRPHLRPADRKELIRVLGRSENKGTIREARMMEARDLLATDPGRSIELAESAGEFFNDTATTEIYTLAESDPAAALRLAVLAERRESRIRDAVRSSMSHHPQKTGEAIDAMPEGPDRTLALAVFEDYKKHHLPELVDYRSMPAGEGRNRAFATHAQALQKVLPDERVIELVKKYIAENEVGPAEDWMVAHLIPMWVRHDPGDLAAWAATQPRSLRRVEALRAFAGVWDKFSQEETRKRLAALGLHPSELKPWSPEVR